MINSNFVTELVDIYRNDEKTIIIKRLSKKPTVVLNLFQHLFTKRFRNPLELLFHLPLIKQYLIVLFGRVQSLILFALQILFAMLRATSSFGLRPHTLSQNNTQLFCSAEYKIRKFGMTKNKTNGHAELVSASLLRP